MSTLHNDLNHRTANNSVFSCDSDTAQAIFLAGSFNDWNPGATPMAREDSRHWNVTLPLPPGRYEYKFVVDGEWCCEPGCAVTDIQCTHCVMNEFGTMNRVLAVAGV
jgi:1,4-alpha-glucan branching enzyme